MKTYIGFEFATTHRRYQGKRFKVTKYNPRASKYPWVCTEIGGGINPVEFRATTLYIESLMNGVDLEKPPGLSPAEELAAKKHVQSIMQELNARTGLSVKLRYYQRKRSHYNPNTHTIEIGVESLARVYQRGYSEYKSIKHLIPGAASSPTGFLGVWYLICHEYAHAYRHLTTGRCGSTKRVWSRRSGAYQERNVWHDVTFANMMIQMMELLPFKEV